MTSLSSVILLVIVALGAALRIERTLAHPVFDRARPAAVVRADPALLLYLTQRVDDAGGGVPDDWRADPRIEHPGTVDIPATFTVGQEFIVSWVRRTWMPDTPLHVVAVRVLAVLAALCAVGVYGLAREVTGSAGWAAFGAALYALLPANYRTIGFVMVREDLALPLFALHLWALARALRTDGAGAWALAGALLGATLATWHASGLLAALEGLVLLVALLRADPARARRAWLGCVPLVLATLLVPALLAKGGPLALGPAVMLGLALAASVRGRGPRLAAVFGLPLVCVLCGALFTGGARDMSHVAQLVFEKLIHAGGLPRDPALLSFESRMMWQGPFRTSTLDEAATWYQLALVVLPFVLALSLWRGAGVERVVAGLCLIGVVAGWFVARLIVLPGLLAPVLLAAGARRMVNASQEPFGQLGLAALLFLQGVLFFGWVGRYQTGWLDPRRARENVEAVDAVRRLVPEGEAVAADFMLSPTILACTGHPIALQPKWERAATRARVERFWLGFHFGPPDTFRRYVTRELDCRYLLVDRDTLFRRQESRYLAGYDARETEPRAGTAGVLAALEAPQLPGFELLWQSPPWELDAQARPGWVRLYRLRAD